MIKGVVYKKIENPKKAKSAKGGYKKRYGIVRNKKFKYYRDREMRDLAGVFDFDRIQCVVMIDDGSNRNDTDSESPINRKDKHKYNEPRKFRIEVMGCNKQFLFMV